MAEYVLSEKDREWFKQLVAEYLRKYINVLSQTPTQADRDRQIQTPDVHIAKPQTGAGIPALVPGTGGDYDVPGEASCDIYRIDVSGVSPELQPVTDLERTVYNLREAVIPQEWVTIQRTKFGRWIVMYPPTQSARMIHGKLRAPLSTGDATFLIDNIKSIFGESPVSSGSDTLLIRNSHQFDGDDNGRVVAVYCETNGFWEAIQITCAVGT